MESQRFIITGGPGSGKSTLLEALRLQGFPCYREVSRELIRQQSGRPDGVTPWRNLPAFADLAFREMMRRHDEADGQSGPCFFDRGIPDIFGYLSRGGHGIPEEYLEAHAVSCRYHDTVFILPHWPEIYVNDAERPQTIDEAEELFHAIRSAYASLGYTLVEVPKETVEARVGFVLSTILHSVERAERLG